MKKLLMSILMAIAMSFPMDADANQVVVFHEGADTYTCTYDDFGQLIAFVHTRYQCWESPKQLKQ